MHTIFSLARKKILVIVLFCTLFLMSFGTPPALAKQPPTTEGITFAKKTADLLEAELFAALLQEFAGTTVNNFENGKLAVSLIFDDSHTNFRLVGQEQPLSKNDLPMDIFEREALEKALKGQPFETVEKVKGKFFYRRSIPLSNFDPSCAICHSNFGSVDPKDYVGLLALKIPTTNPLE